ncbi:MAG: TetR/AcrR family transcriptional regulator [Alphaproteobacteria bacterium]|nr:TetR/AcrR family transcriptional regulator [Alphaproteobacteria bacterium]
MAYRRTERVEEQLQDKRNRILQAVRAVVGEVGFNGAQVTTVAEAAGVATGTVYRHFPSKGELFAEALALNAQHEVDVIAAVAQADGSASSRLADAVRVFARRAVRARRLAWAMIAEPAEAEVDAARIIYRRAFAAVFQGLVEDGIEGGEFPPQNPAASATCLMGALSEGLIGPLAPEAGTLPDTRALVNAIVAFCLQAVSARPFNPPLRVVEESQ